MNLVTIGNMPLYNLKKIACARRNFDEHSSTSSHKSDYISITCHRKSDDPPIIFHHEYKKTDVS